MKRKFRWEKRQKKKIQRINWSGKRRGESRNYNSLKVFGEQKKYVSLSIVVQLTTLVYIFGVNRRHANNFVAQKSLRRRCACVPRQSLDGIAQCANNGNLVLYKNLQTPNSMAFVLQSICSQSAINLRNKLTYIVHFCCF